MSIGSLLIVTAALMVVLGALFVTILQIGLDEADDPTESSVQDLTEFEKRHVERSDVNANND